MILPKEKIFVVVNGKTGSVVTGGGSSSRPRIFAYTELAKATKVKNLNDNRAREKVHRVDTYIRYVETENEG